MTAKRPKAASKKKVVVHHFEKEKSKPHSNDRVLPFEIDPKKIEESLNKLKDQVVVWAKRGRYTKVRFKFRGKQLLPDLPLAAVAAVEGVTFYWAGLLRMLVFNLAGRTVLEVELVNDSEKKIQSGKEALLSGELDRALELFKEAMEMDAENPNVHLNLGVARKLKGELLASRASLQKAKALDPKGPVGAEAERLLAGMPKPPSASPPLKEGAGPR